MSQTTGSGRPRTALGPLTTTFTPPASCTIGAIEVFRNAKGTFPYLRSRICGTSHIYADTLCWPSVPLDIKGIAADDGAWGFYSPGLVCPAGYTSACSATAGGKSGWPVEFKMLPGETGVGCCPSGFTCSALNGGQNCRSIAGYGTSFSVQTCSSGTWISPRMLSIPYTTDSVAITNYPVHAPMIEIRWQSSDRQHLVISNSTTADPPGGPVGLPSNKPGFSTAVKAAIGVCVPLLVIAIFFAALFIWRRHRRRRPLVDRGSTNEKPELPGDSVALVEIKPELDSYLVHEAPEQRKHTELDVHSSLERYEMEARSLY